MVIDTKVILEMIKKKEGIYYYKSGSKYEGEWRNNNKKGKGIYYVNNGDRNEVILKIVNKKEKEFYI